MEKYHRLCIDNHKLDMRKMSLVRHFLLCNNNRKCEDIEYDEVMMVFGNILHIYYLHSLLVLMLFFQQL